jgi:hypothetical protein
MEFQWGLVPELGGGGGGGLRDVICCNDDIRIGIACCCTFSQGKSQIQIPISFFSFKKKIAHSGIYV